MRTGSLKPVPTVLAGTSKYLRYDAMRAAMSVSAGDRVLLRTTRNEFAFLDLGLGLSFRLHKKQCESDALLSAQCGASFVVSRNGQLLSASRKSLEDVSLLLACRPRGSVRAFTANADNRNLNDTNSAQRLSTRTVSTMKSRGSSGIAIVEALTLGSATWDTKTEFSKVKWVKRKADKYISGVQVMEPTARNVAEAYVARAINKSWICEPHTLAQLLAYANVKTGSRTIVCDASGGLVTGAIAERSGTTGKILILPEAEDQLLTDAIGKLNETHDLYKCTTTAPVSVLSTYYEVKRPVKSSALVMQPTGYLGKEGQNCDVIRDSWIKHKAHALVATTVPNMYKFRSYVEIQVIASRLEPLSVFKAALPLLHHGSTLVVYSEYMEPLTRAFVWLEASKAFANIQIRDVCQRDFQIMENRSHPNMTMRSNAAYILSAIKLARSPAD